VPDTAVDLEVPDLATLHQRRSEKWSAEDSDVVASTVAEMDFPLASEIIAALHAAIDRHDLGYTPPTGTQLPAAFADFALRRLHWTVDQDQITLVPDVMAGLIELCRVLLQPGEQVAFFTPAYPPFFDELPQARVQLVHLPLGAGNVVDLDILEAALARRLRALILTNPHNPTGRVLPRTELEKIAELCARYDCWVFADEIHAPLVLKGATHTPWLEVSDAAREHGIALTSASKAFNVAGLKTALLMTAAERPRQAVRRVPSLTDRVGILGVIAAEAGSTRVIAGWTPFVISSPPTASFLVIFWQLSFPRSSGSRRKRHILHGWTVVHSILVPILHRNSWSEVASLSVPVWTMGRRALASSG
jgi:cystathionine beta-lyase